MKVIALSIPGSILVWYILSGIISNQWGKRNDICNIWLRLSNPHLSTCSKCGVPWNHCNSKIINWSPTMGTFALCDYCWEQSSIMDRKQYFAKVYFYQVSLGMEDDHFCELMEAIVKESNKKSPSEINH